MNLKKKMRRSSLAALITLALTSSALAMPTGGVVQSGDVNIGGSTDFSTVADGATITAGTDSTINWNTFNIGSGETLNFNIASDKTLVNNVTGSQLSDILGTMNQNGGNLVLVNPNGIHIGGNAVLNVANLTLSTLGMTESGNQLSFAKGATNGTINIDRGAEFNAVDCVSIFAGKVNVADGVTFNLGDGSMNKTILDIKAMDRADYTMVGGDGKVQNVTHNAGNDVVFNGTVNVKNNQECEVEIGGATVTATGAKFLGEGTETTIYAASKFHADERDADDAKHVFTADVTAANRVSLNGVTAEGKSLQLGGGVIDIKNSTADVYRLGVEAVATYRATGNGAVMDDTSAPDRTINIAGSKLKANQGMIYGGKITVADDATIEMKSNAHNEAEVLMIAGNRFKRQHGNDHGDELLTYRGAQGNDLAFHGTVSHTTDGKASFGIVGHTVNADRAKLHGTSTEFSLSALTKVDYDQTAPRWQDYWQKNESSAANTLQANRLDVCTQREFYADGGSVSLRNSTIATGMFNIYAYAQSHDDGDTDVGNLVHENKTAGVNNVVHLKNVTVTHPTDAEYSGASIFGGKVTLEESKLQENWMTALYAGSSHNSTDTRSTSDVKVTVTKDNELGLWNAEVSGTHLNLGAGKIGVWQGSNLTAANTLRVNPADAVIRTNDSTASLLRDPFSHVKRAGTELAAFTETSEPVPPVPQPPTPPAPPVTPDAPHLSADDTANIAEGGAKAQAALTETTQEKRAEKLMETVAQLNENKAVSRRQTAGVVIGIVQEIANAPALSDGEKVALVEKVLNAYAPVQEAKTAQENIATNTLDEAANAATTVSAAPVYPDTSEVAENVTFA
ncbi:filamentous hemagglutinin N-terminal domain-containing protein [Selenomonas dianae]|uniref:Filamentous haemagglutinin FhaB/tRNA nuclease CdiA-like TPS domain-containing protein n=1 Tax=Selenomonas dianae TaxID=135079 RepID=A0ABP3CKZ6_9FIRM|nr:filamentous hemagglutinin N-terminal domain-containing protein [Selenomonas dianae]WLD81807.1 filamentous hemagglutinin N-terminal domain-containing protein [Selenomonas dianae]